MRYLYVKYQNPIPYGSKDIAQVKVFFKTRSKFKIKVTRSKVLEPKERSLHEVSVWEISEPYLLWFKRYSPGYSFCDADTRVMTIALRTVVPAS
jgi:hypothetical protein